MDKGVVVTWANFTRDEFKCRCGCNTNEIKDEFIDVLQAIRTEIGIPLHISSGYRCSKHHVEARKDSPGEHTEGTCADVYVSHSTAFAVTKAAFARPEVTGIGVNQKGHTRFIHIGIGEAKTGRPRPHIWSY